MKLYELLQQESYKFVPVEKTYYREFESLNYWGDAPFVFDKLQTKHNRIPSQQEYLEEGLKLAERHFKGKPRQFIKSLNTYHTFKWDEKLEASVKYRLNRTYISLLIEKQIEEFFQEKGLKVFTDKLIDDYFGVDLVLLLGEKLFYIHVLKNSSFALSALDKKKDYSFEYINFTKVDYSRNWNKGHQILAYNDILSDRMQEVNGNLLFSDRYLERWAAGLEKATNFDTLDGSSEIEFFINKVMIPTGNLMTIE